MCTVSNQLSFDVDSHAVRSPSSSLRIFVLLAIALLLTSCGGNQAVFTDSHLLKLQESFVGREFVFRTDWYEKFVIHQGSPKHISLAFAGKNPSNYVKNAAQRYGDFEAPAGTVARITDVRPESSYKLLLSYTTQQGNKGQIPLMRFHYTQHSASIAWIEQQLTRETISFIVNPDEVEKQMQMALPAPPPEPVLTKPPVSPQNLNREPSLSRLGVQAVPETIRPAETLKLELDYTLDAGGLEGVQVTETRTLFFRDKTLPGYPKNRTVLRDGGRHTTSFRQKIPSKAPAGTYTYLGEVCIPEAGCVSRKVRFTIVP